MDRHVVTQIFFLICFIYIYIYIYGIYNDPNSFIQTRNRNWNKWVEKWIDTFTHKHFGEKENKMMLVSEHRLGLNLMVINSIFHHNNKKGIFLRTMLELFRDVVSKPRGSWWKNLFFSICKPPVLIIGSVYSHDNNETVTSWHLSKMNKHIIRTLVCVFTSFVMKQQKLSGLMGVFLLHFKL